ncbi:unnamed protein product [Symbiodinium pilosum]|uniref:Uncharacterized protein n=1 Tax=Symbiodinium pilosum TaxID=2952 RepID=A0A812T5T2_SYMPI|nr:unnamed protein product [Symbiodinium pilosum]
MFGQTAWQSWRKPKPSSSSKRSALKAEAASFFQEFSRDVRQLPQGGSEDLTLEKANEAVLTVKKRFWALKKGLWGQLGWNEVYQECCKIDQHGKFGRDLMRKAFALVVGSKFTVEAIDRLVCIAIPDEAGTAFDLAQEWKAAEKTEESSRWRQSQGWWQDGSWSQEGKTGATGVTGVSGMHLTRQASIGGAARP